MADQRCLIFQRDNTILLETASPGFPAARDALRRFAELVQSAGGYHLYRPSEVTLDDAAQADELFSVLMGEDVESRREFIQRNAKDVRFLDI